MICDRSFDITGVVYMLHQRLYDHQETVVIFKLSFLYFHMPKQLNCMFTNVLCRLRMHEPWDCWPKTSSAAALLSKFALSIAVTITLSGTDSPRMFLISSRHPLSLAEISTLIEFKNSKFYLCTYSRARSKYAIIFRWDVAFVLKYHLTFNTMLQL